MKRASAKELKDVMRRAMLAADTPPDIMYAFEKTDRIVTEENKWQLTPEELAEWEAAIEEYRQKQK